MKAFKNVPSPDPVIEIIEIHPKEIIVTMYEHFTLRIVTLALFVIQTENNLNA